jgi:HPt (histidine-containing phosphotransfer) domain-containing protein
MKIDLDYIYTISDGDRDFIREILETFVKITPESIDAINESLEQKQWKEVARVAHKIKPSILLLGVDELTKLIKEIEQMAKNQEELDQLTTKISLLNQYSLDVLADIDELLSTGRY